MRRTSKLAVWMAPLAAALLATIGAEAWAAEPLEPAYVFLLDNSLSMHEKPGSDVHRLAVFAARAIVQVLDDKDGATIVPLEPSRMSGFQQPAIRPLSANRKVLLDMLTPNKSPTCQNPGDHKDWVSCHLADYSGRATPCNDGFARVRKQVAQYTQEVKAKFPGASGDLNIIYLTDGACEDEKGNKERVDAAALEKSLREAAPGMNLSLQVMSFEGQGNSFTPEVETLASRLRGKRFPIADNQLVNILKPFGESIAAARRVPFVPPITSSNGEHLMPFTAAERVYLIGVAQVDGNEKMQLQVVDEKTKKPVKLDVRASETFQYNGPNSASPGTPLKKYFLTVASYAGREAAVPSLKVTGVVKNWTVMQLPDYRIRVETDVCPGECNPKGGNCPKEATKTQFDLGTNVCRVVRLKDRQGNVLDQAFAAVQVGLAAGDADAATFSEESEWKKRYPDGTRDKPDHGGLNEFSTTASCSENTSVSPWVNVRISDDTLPIFRLGGTSQYRCHKGGLLAEPSELKLEPIVKPGGVGKATFRLQGDFPASDVTAKTTWVGGKPDPTVQLFVGDKPEGQRFTVSPDQELTLEVRPAQWCGVGDARPRDIEARVELSVKAPEGVRSVMLHVTGQWLNETALNHNGQKGPPMKWSLPGHSESVEEPLKLVAGIPPGDVKWQVKFEPEGDFPTSELQLEVNGTGKAEDWKPLANTGHDELKGEALFAHTASSGGEPLPLRLRARAMACCAPGASDYRGNLVLLPEGKTGAKSVKVPVQVEVTKRAWVACYWKPFAVFMAVLFVIFLLWFIGNVKNGIHPLQPTPQVEDDLKLRCKPDIGAKNKVVRINNVKRQAGIAYLLGHAGTLVQLGLGRKSIWEAVDVGVDSKTATRPAIVCDRFQWLVSPNRRPAPTEPGQLLFMASPRAPVIRSGSMAYEDLPGGKTVKIGDCVVHRDPPSRAVAPGRMVLRPTTSTNVSGDRITEWRISS